MLFTLFKGYGNYKYSPGIVLQVSIYQQPHTNIHRPINIKPAAGYELADDYAIMPIRRN